MRRLARIAALLMCWFTGVSRGHGVAGAGASWPWGVRPSGETVTRLAPEGSQAVVLFFVATDCPVSNRLFPEMKRLREVFASSPVRVWFVYPDEETASRVGEHQQTFDSKGDAILDTGGHLTHLAGVIVTPEIAVLRPDGRGAWTTAFRGRIDDRYVQLGLERPSATAHYGEDAIRAVLAGQAPRPDPGQPVGCAIYNSHWKPGSAGKGGVF